MAATLTTIDWHVNGIANVCDDRYGNSMLKNLLSLFLFIFLPVSSFASLCLPCWCDYNWRGFYVGGNLAYQWVRHTADLVFPVSVTGVNLPDSFNARPEGAIGGVQAGYNWQCYTCIAGVEADFESGIHGVSSAIRLASTSGRAKIQMPWFGTVRARLGYTTLNTVIVYGTLGYAYGKVKDSAYLSVPVASFSDRLSELRSGWTIGVALNGLSCDAGALSLNLYM